MILKEKLIRKLLQRQCTREELEQLFSILEQDDSETGPDILLEVIRQIEADQPKINPKRSDRIFQQVLQEVGVEEENNIRPIQSVNRRRFWWSAAAALLLLAMAGTWWFGGSEDQFVEQTNYGETREIELPDGSIVTLNGNTSLTFGHWKEAATRTVYLKGEAYFKVKKIPSTQAKFQVITDDLTVEVLGTAFNVNSHKNETRVFLEEGKVKLKLNHDVEKVLDLSPGEAMRYSALDQELTPPAQIVRDKQPNWRAGFMLFTETPLQSILEKFAQAHQLAFTIVDTTLAKTRFTVTLPLEDINETMDILGKSIGASIIKEGNQYIIDVGQD